MAQRLCKGKLRRVGAKKLAVKEPDELIVVGNYKEKQLAWIKKNGVYNWPVRAGDEFTPESFGKIKELWLYADVKSRRHVFSAEFIGQMTQAEFRTTYPSHAKLGASKQKAYYVFKAKSVDYPSELGNQTVIARTADFGKRCAKVRKAIEQFKQDGEFAPLAAYLPKELAKVPRQQLCVCEAAVQLDFYCSMFAPVESGSSVAKKVSTHNVISLFSGAMGLDNGIEKAGLNIRLCVEFQHAMAETIRANRPNIPLIEDDVRNYSGEDLRNRAGLLKKEEVFLVCGGPPCQAFSTAGKRLGFDDDRGNVFLKYLDLIGEIKPKYFLLENVRGLLSASYRSTEKGTALLYALKKIRDIGYSATFTLYDAANYGVPQKRERVIILGNREGYEIPLIPPTHSVNGLGGLKRWATFRGAVAGLKHCTALPIPAKRLKYFAMLGPGQYWKDLPVHVQQEAMGKSFALPGGKTGFFRRLAWDEPSPTLVTCPTMPATDLMHPEENRALSIEEYARIQMFPDDWVFKGKLADIYKQIGNAVPVGMGYAAAKHLLWFDSLSPEEKEKAQLIDPNVVYSRYRNTNHEYFEKLQKQASRRAE